MMMTVRPVTIRTPRPVSSDSQEKHSREIVTSDDDNHELISDLIRLHSLRKHFYFLVNFLPTKVVAFVCHACFVQGALASVIYAEEPN